MQRTGRGPFLVAHMVVSRSVGHSWIKASREAAATQVEVRARHGQGHRTLPALLGLKYPCRVGPHLLLIMSTG